MSLLWKVATSPTTEETIRESLIKKSLTTELGQAVRNLQQENVGKSKPVVGGEHVVRICNCLEAIFIHGLKDRLLSKVSAVFGSHSVKMPEPDFWPVVMLYSHKDVLSQVSRLSHINTDVGRCRAWLRLALNDGLITSYIETMIQDRPSLQYYYRSTAYFQDLEQADIMKTYLDGLEVFDFQLTYNCMVLNAWSSTPLIMSGMWIPPPNPEPVMPAMDVVHFFSEEARKTKNKTGKKGKSEKPVSDDKKHGKSDDHESVAEQENSANMENKESSDNYEPKTSSSSSSDIEHILFYDPSPSPNSVPDVDQGFGETTPDTLSLADAQGNRISEQHGWSSSFDQEENVEQKDLDTQSYDSLLQSYNRNRVRPIVGTPDITEFMTSAVTVSKEETQEIPEEDINKSSPQNNEPSLEALEYEVVPKTYVITSESTDEFTKQLLSIIGKICPEKGLDEQNYQCHNCGCPIGMIYGEAKICTYDGYNYCSECHKNDEFYIPAKIIHNWDFQKYPVSIQTKKFLQKVESEPLLDLKTLNPLIYSAVEEMAQLQTLRTQLGFLKSYLFTCRESIAEELRHNVWPREYFYEHIHLYALSDLLQVRNDTLANFLQKVIVFAKKHVLNCQLCSLKGFICEICNNPRVIYPFEVDMTYHCEHCLAVYHNSCMDATKPCPKCERKQKKSSAKEFTWPVEDSD